jgi:hypothetical protein
MPRVSYIRWFENIRLKDIPEVGSKTASLGELYALLAADGGRVPDGFSLTAGAYREVLAAAGAVDKLRRLLAISITTMCRCSPSVPRCPAISSTRPPAICAEEAAPAGWR